MVNPLDSITITASPIGSQLDITWQLPQELPENYKLYIFKKNGELPPQSIIDAYFQNIDNLTGFEYQNVFVFDKLKNETNIIADYMVLNGSHYYYTGILRDETTKEVSLPKSGDAIADCLLINDIVDGKDIVAKTLEKALDTAKDKNGNKLILNKKEIEVVKQFSAITVDKDTFMVERINGAETQRFFGDMMNTYKNSIVLGGVDTDIIRATFLTPAGNDRRDIICNLMRSRKFLLRNLIKKQGIKDVGVAIEGDYFNAIFHGENVIGFTIVFALLIITQSKYDEPVINQHITKMEIQ